MAGYEINTENAGDDLFNVPYEEIMWHGNGAAYNDADEEERVVLGEGRSSPPETSDHPVRCFVLLRALNHHLSTCPHTSKSLRTMSHTDAIISFDCRD